MADSGLLQCAVHDLRNPIAVLRATLEWLGAEVASAGEPADAVRDALSAAERLAAVADDLDLIARLERGDGVSPTNAKLAPTVATALASAAPTRDANVATEIRDDLAVTADAVLLARAVRELVTMTLRAVRPKTRIVVTAAAEDSTVSITVRADVPAAPADAPPDGLGVRVVAAIARAMAGSLEPTSPHAWTLRLPK